MKDEPLKSIPRMYQNMKGKANPAIGQILGHNCGLSMSECVCGFRCRSVFSLLKSGTFALTSRISFINVVAVAVACGMSHFVHPPVDLPVSCRLQAVIL